jgi:hypothetical protein
MLRKAFIERWEHLPPLQVTNSDPSGNVKLKLELPTLIWLRSKPPQHRIFDGLVFDPSNNSSARYYNTWQGLAIKPMLGECPLTDAYIHDVIANNNDKTLQLYSGLPSAHGAEALGEA